MTGKSKGLLRFAVLGAAALAMLAAPAATGGGTAWAAAAQAAAPMKAAAPAVPPGVRGEVQRDLDYVEKQLVSLASAIPADKFTWRPGKGVRSVGEVVLHVAGGNYELGALFGVKPPPTVDLAKIEKQGADKGNAVAAMRVSFQKVRETIAAMSDADLERQVDFFGHPATVRMVLMQTADHAHEHLGQLVAYARMNNIVPPWSAAGH